MMEQSDYIRRDYRTLHIKGATHNRLVLAKAAVQADLGHFITQDAFIEMLLEKHIGERQQARDSLALETA
jgi:hypothetical protein